MDLNPDDRRASLARLLDVLAETISAAEPQSVAALVKQAQAVLKELDELPDMDAEVSPLDELRAARAARNPKASDHNDAGRRNQQRRRGRVQAS